MSFRGRLGNWVARADSLHSRVRRSWYHRVRISRDWTILPYLGFGTATELHVSGRVLRRRHHVEPNATDRQLRNFAEFWKWMESDELPHAGVRAWFADARVDVRADDEGYFAARLDLATPVAANRWHAVRLELLDATGRNGTVQTMAEAFVPSTDARFGIVSDIDDTVLWSDVRNRWRMLLMLMRSNARTRKPFKGVGAFYRALQRGPDGTTVNPLFYVSSSPWNLYAPLVAFLDVNGIPRAPLMLRDFGEHLMFGSGDHGSHKRACIDRVLDLYPTLPFVLIGDSGERDPEIYAEIVRRRPGRVRIIYIRSVNPDPSRIEAIDRLVKSARTVGVELVLAPDSEFAAAHAAAQGLIDVAALADVRDDKKADASADG